MRVEARNMPFPPQGLGTKRRRQEYASIKLIRAAGFEAISPQCACSVVRPSRTPDIKEVAALSFLRVSVAETPDLVAQVVFADCLGAVCRLMCLGIEAHSYWFGRLLVSLGLGRHLLARFLRPALVARIDFAVTVACSPRHLEL